MVRPNRGHCKTGSVKQAARARPPCRQRILSPQPAV